MRKPIDGLHHAIVGPFGHWWRLLPVRLALAINLAAVAVLSAFWFADYRRTATTYYAGESRRLREEAKVLRAAQVHFERRAEFREFIDTFCQQMDVAASPGHHIAVFDSDGTLVARAHERPDVALEAAMAANRGLPDSRLRTGGDDFVSVSIEGTDGTNIAVAQSLAPIRQVIRAQAASRAASFGILAFVVLVVTSGVVFVWVHVPLRRLVKGFRAIGERRFDVKVRPTGSEETRYLAVGLNEMAAALEQVEHDRRQQMKRARGIQGRLLPSIAEHGGAFRIDAVFQPAESVGGDFYDVIKLPDGSLLVTVLDVSGHGVAAALHTALLRTVLRYEAQFSADPGTIATAMNREFSAVSDSGEFATCCLIRIRTDGGLEYANAGHEPPVIAGPRGTARLLDAGGLAIGIVDTERYTTARTGLEPASRLYLYTDGLHEIPRANGTLVGRECLVNILTRSDEAPRDVLEQLRTLSGNGRFDDDVTLIRIQRG